jgi:hypothetical protein
MRIMVPMVSWLICVPFSFLFLLDWGFSGFGPGPYLQASSYLCVAVPVLAVGAVLLLLQFKRLTWLSFFLHALPWSAFPWLSIACCIPPGERGPWIELGAILGVPTAACFCAVLALQRWPLRLPAQAVRALRALGLAAIAPICVVALYEYQTCSGANRRAVKYDKLRGHDESWEHHASPGK